MHANLKHAQRGQAIVNHGQRGQAIVETVVFLPMFVLVFFGIIWTVQASVQSERVQSAIRYAGLISQRANPYADYSLYSMYSQLGSLTLPAVPCTIPLTDALSDASPTYRSATAVTASTPFWTPASPQTQGSCTNNGLFGFAAGAGFSQDVILSEQQPGMTSYIPVPPTLVAAMGASLTSFYANGYFFKGVGENVLVACYASLNKQVTSSLQYGTDTSAADLPVTLGSVVTPIYLTANTACTTP
jgi:Flp pilus assembly protein TadG